MKRFALPLFFACVALAGCGSVTAGLNFKAPAGWMSTPSIMGRFQMWIKQSSDKKDDAQMLFLVRGQNVKTMDFKSLPQAGTNVRDLKQSAIKICGNRPAQYMSGVSTSAKNGDMAIEMISAPVGDESYLAVYMRPKALPADVQAETAIRSLCMAKVTT